MNTVQPSSAAKRKPKGPIKFNIQLNEEQKEAKDEILANDITVLRGQAGSGKAQPLSARVLTPNGYVRMGDLDVGDYISTPAGGKAAILGIYPQGIKDVYKITFSDKSTTYACLDHLWAVQHRDDKHTPKRRKGYANNNHDRWRILTTKQLLDAGLQRAEDCGLEHL